MKKRLLSAALALAMVLTLLPVSAFALTTSDFAAGTSTVTYYKEGAAFPDGTKAKADGWYYGWYNDTDQKYVYEAKSGGVVLTGSAGSGSGVYYESFTAALAAINAGTSYYGNCITLTTAGSSSGIWPYRDLTIDLHGVTGANFGTITFGGANPADGSYGTNLTITDTTKTSIETPTSVTASIKVASRDGVNITLSNVDLGSGTVEVGYNTSAKVSMTNAKTGNISLTATTATGSTSTSGGEVTLDNSTAGDITITHTAGTGTSSGGSIELKNRSQAGKLIVDHTSTTGTSSGGSITVSNSTVTSATRVESQYGGKYTITDSSITGPINLNGCETELSARNSTLGQIAIFGTKDPDVATAHTTAPKVTLSAGSSATSIAKRGSDEEKLSNPYEINLTNAQVNTTFTLDYAKLNVTNGKVGGKTTLKGGEINLTGDGITMDEIELGDATNAGPEVTLNATGTNITTGSIKAATDNVRTVNFTTGTSDTNKFGSSANGGAADIDLGSKYTVNIQGGNFTGWLKSEYVHGLPYMVIDSTRAPHERSYYKADQMNDLVSRYQSAATKPTVVLGTGSRDCKLKLLDNRASDGNGLVIDKDAKELLVVEFNSSNANTFILPTKVSNMNSVQWVRYKVTTKDDGSIESQEVADVRTGGSPLSPEVGLYDDSFGLSGEDASKTITLYVQSADYSVNQINRVWADNSASGHRVTATLGSNRVISLSGTLGTYSGDTAVIPLVLETDAGNVKVNVNQLISGATRSTYFVKGSVNPVGAMSVSDDGKTLRVGNIAYTLDGSAVKTRVNGLKTTNGEGALPQIVTTVTSSVDQTDKGRVDLGKSMSSQGADVFNFVNSPAVLQALGRIEAGISESEIKTWIDQAQRKAWEKHPDNKGRTPSVGDLAATGYDTVYLVPYLDVQLTAWNPQSPTGLLTATMTPSYKIEVRSSQAKYNELYKYSNATQYNSTGYKDAELEPLNGAIVIRKGSLGTLSSDFGKVSIKLNVPNFDTTKTDDIYAHQGSTYVSGVTKAAASGSTPATATFVLYHTAVSGEGLGVVQLNTSKPLVELVRHENNAKLSGVEDHLKYDVLQAAVNDALNGDTIYLDDGYKNNQTDTITVTGRARQFTIYARGNTSISAAKGATGVTVTPSTTDTSTGTTTGRTYTVQLARDNYVTTEPDKKPEENKGTVSIYVSPVSNGSASASASSAKAGDAITVTVSPASGYNAGGLTIRTNTGASVSYTSIGTNTYRFTVPNTEGLTSITVTPAFVRVNTGVLITVSGGTYGTATTSAGSNRVAVGSTVSVTVEPRSGYRTMGLYVTADTGSTATPYRTGVNTFTFTVPNATSSVVVTPRFDVNNGTIFEDVWSTDYYSSPVSWAVRQGVTDGTDTYHFSPGQSCNRVQMVTFLWRAAGRPSTAGMANPFYDVSPSMGNDFYNAILWANAKGITNGDGSTTRFNPYKTVTRAEAVTFLWRYEGQPAASTNSGFYDVPAREWYAPAVTWAVGRGITNGDGSTTRFNPNGACLRAQIVTFLYRDITGARA